MKNKYVAVVLVILAVAAVSYRIFFSGGPDGKAKQVQTGPTVLHDPGMAGSGTLLQSVNNTQSIRIDPQMLLENVDHTMVRYQLRELSEVGINILADSKSAMGGDLGVNAVNESGETYKYSLFAIIIDQDRKIAVINDRICRIGDILPGGAVIEMIEKGRVELRIENEKVVLQTNPRVDKIKPVQGGWL